MRTKPLLALLAAAAAVAVPGCQSSSEIGSVEQAETAAGPGNPCWNIFELVPGMIPVIGRSWDVEPFKNDPKYCVLDLDDHLYSKEANAAWIDSIARVKPPYVVVASQLTAEKLWNSKDWKPSIFMEELLQLRGLGYDVPTGSITLPDGSVAPFAPAERQILLDPSVPPTGFTAADAKTILRRAANLAIPAALLAGIIGELTGIVDPATGRLVANAASCADALRSAGSFATGGARGLVNLTFPAVKLLAGCTGVLGQLGVDVAFLDGPLAEILRCGGSLVDAVETAEIPVINFITSGVAVADCLYAAAGLLQDTAIDRALTRVFGYDYWRDGVPRDLWDRPYVPGLPLEYHPTITVFIDGDFEHKTCLDPNSIAVISTQIAEFHLPWEGFVRLLLGQPIRLEKPGIAPFTWLLSPETVRGLRQPGAADQTRIAQRGDRFVFEFIDPWSQWSQVIPTTSGTVPPPCTPPVPPDPPPPPPPTQTCGNGVREGSETCDGYDMCSGPARQCSSDCTQCVCNDTTSPGPECGYWTDLCGAPRDNGDPCAMSHGSNAWYCEGNRCECEDTTPPPSGECYAGYVDACGDFVPGKYCNDPERPLCDESLNQCYGACDDNTCYGVCNYCGFEDGWCTDYRRPADSINQGCNYSNCYCYNYP
jgi:hypothetical protein